jgi:precorrin-3B C17-methyltransferase
LLYVVGIGPGAAADRTHRAEAAIRDSSVIVGYTRYLELIADLTTGKELLASGMTHEVERCRLALERAAAGAAVALISSGDAGVYGMAGLALELAQADGLTDKVAIEIIPGVTAATAAAARLGAPLMVDFAVISLSDLLVSWEVIRKRLQAAAAADFVTALYNPRSHTRVRQLAEAVAIFLDHRGPGTPVGIATALGTAEESVVLSTLGRLREEEVNMRSVVIIGNSTTHVIQGLMVTRRGYEKRF